MEYSTDATATPDPPRWVRRQSRLARKGAAASGGGPGRFRARSAATPQHSDHLACT